MNLFQLAERYGNIAEAFETAAVDELANMAGMFLDAEGDLDTKLDAYCAVIGQLEAVSKARAEEAKRIADLASVDANAARRMKDTLVQIFDRLGFAKRESPRYKIGIRGNGGKSPVVIHDDATIPDEYLIQRMEINRDLIRTNLEAGEILEFAELLPRGRHISIR